MLSALPAFAGGAGARKRKATEREARAVSRRGRETTRENGARLPSEASPAKVAKDSQHNNDDDDDPKPARHA